MQNSASLCFTKIANNESRNRQQETAYEQKIWNKANKRVKIKTSSICVVSDLIYDGNDGTKHLKYMNQTSAKLKEKMTLQKKTLLIFGETEIKQNYHSHGTNKFFLWWCCSTLMLLCYLFLWVKNIQKFRRKIGLEKTYQWSSLATLNYSVISNNLNRQREENHGLIEYLFLNLRGAT